MGKGVEAKIFLKNTQIFMLFQCFETANCGGGSYTVYIVLDYKIAKFTKYKCNTLVDIILYIFNSCILPLIRQ